GWKGRSWARRSTPVPSPCRRPWTWREAPMARDLPPSSPFAGDDGSPDAHLAPALALEDDGERLRAVVAALAEARVLVPVVAHLDEPARSGQKQAGAAMVTVSTPDGRAAIPVFSGMDSLRAWRPDARPVPVPAPRA